MISVVTPFLAYFPAEQLHVSGVLATVVTGVYLGTRTEGMLQPASRVSGAIFWRTFVFLLESALFVLLGLELRTVVDHLSVVLLGRLAGRRGRRRGGGDPRGQDGLGADLFSPLFQVPARQALRPTCATRGGSGS